MADLDPKDGGYKSRKMVMAYVSICLITITFILTAKWPSLNVSFPDFCMALLAATGIYTGGNAFTKISIAKHTATQKTKEKAKVDDPDA